MLTRLTIQDVVLIDKLALDLDAGLNAFTGETGAGKSILLDAMGLALGERSDASLIRHGATQASVSAEFSLPLPPALAALLDEQGLQPDETLILRRVLAKDGKSRAFVNDQPISIGLLKQMGERLLEIHGQFETHGLLNAATHKTLLDSFAGNTDLVKETSACFTDWQQAQKDFEEASASKAQAEAEEDFLRASVAELEALAPEAGEIERLAEQRANLMHREKIIEALKSVDASLSSERGAAASLSSAGKALARIVDKVPDLADLLTQIDRLSGEIDETAQTVSRKLYDVEGSTATLQQIEDRLFGLRALARKHSIPPEELADLHKKLSAQLALLSDQGDRLAALSKAVTKAKEAYVKKAEALHKKRAATAEKLVEQISKELPPLKLEQARFEIKVDSLTEAQWSADGMDRVTFLAATNPGSPAGALHKIASGGELARFMLAIKVILATSDPVPVLVFDEVDTGIGGATASAVGERLARLAKDVQVLVVTHSPQVAARGHAHLRVEKSVKAGKAFTTVTRLAPDARVEEIARMLSGKQTTEAARQAAQSLLNDSLAAPKTKEKAKRS